MAHIGVELWEHWGLKVLYETGRWPPLLLYHLQHRIELLSEEHRTGILEKFGLRYGPPRAVSAPGTCSNQGAHPEPAPPSEPSHAPVSGQPMGSSQSLPVAPPSQHPLASRSTPQASAAGSTVTFNQLPAAVQAQLLAANQAIISSSSLLRKRAASSQTDESDDSYRCSWEKCGMLLANPEVDGPGHFSTRHRSAFMEQTDGLWKCKWARCARAFESVIVFGTHLRHAHFMPAPQVKKQRTADVRAATQES